MAEYALLFRLTMSYHLNDRTPAQALCEALGRKGLPPLVPKADIDKEKAAA